MTLNELIKRLQDIREECPDTYDPEVTFHYQSYEGTIINVRGAFNTEGKPVVWLAEGTQVDTSNRHAWDEAGFFAEGDTSPQYDT